jgi:ATP-dependent protease ClpP protease subunit
MLDDAIEPTADTKMNNGAIEHSKGSNFVKENNVFIYGEFNESIANTVVPALLEEIKKQKKLKEGKIRFYIDSNGGYTRYLYILLALIEDAKKSGIIIETYVFSYAYSCGSMLAAAGTKGHRYVSSHAEHLCHLGFASTGYVGNDVQLNRGAERAKDHFNKVRSLYRKYAKLKNLEASIENDNLFIRGRDIIRNGLADKMVD